MSDGDNQNYHVTPKDGVWQVKGSGNERASKLFNTQTEARTYGRELAIKNHSELLVHRPNGQIREKNSYGNDPESIKG